MSVVVPTRNRAESLARCLGSLVELDYPRLEIIVVDNAPTGDETKNCVERFGARVRYMREEHPGASAARNRGLHEAHGAIVAFTDDDVLVDRFWIRALVTCFERHPDVACVTGLVVPAELETPAQVWFERYGGFNKGYEPQLFDTTTHRGNSWLYPYAAGTFGSGNNVAFRAASLELIGGYDCALGPGTPARAGEDLALFVEIITSGHTLAYEPRAVVRHHHRAEYDELRQQFRDYGVGLSAMLTAQSLRGLRRGLRILLCIPVGLRLLLSPTSSKNSRRGGDYPRADRGRAPRLRPRSLRLLPQFARRPCQSRGPRGALGPGSDRFRHWGGGLPATACPLSHTPLPERVCADCDDPHHVRARGPVLGACGAPLQR